MAVESRRGCGYRKVGGTYMVSGEMFGTCDRLPFPLTVCPCCGEGYRPSRALREIDPEKMLGYHDPEICACPPGCLVCMPPGIIKNDLGHYLEWIGGSFYKNPQDFTAEALKLGISRRLKGGIPRNMVVGKTVVYLAHREILFIKRVQKGNISRGIFEKGAGIFGAFIVRGLEHICTESELKEVGSWMQYHETEGHKVEEAPKGRLLQLLNLADRGVKLIAVPDNDKDHQ